MVKIVTREQWQAARPARTPTRITRTKGVKIHYTGSYVNPKIVTDHGICLKLTRDIQRMHMAGGRGEKYIDIGYNLLACPHRYVIMGRGLGVIPAANGAGLNDDHYAICALVGSSGAVAPSDELLHALCDGIELLRTKAGAGREVKGHRDGYATSCPGGPLYAWVRRGAPRPGAPAGKTPKPVPMPDGVPSFVRTLRLVRPYLRGPDVRMWQERLVRRGWRLDVDGVYGPQSAGVCEAFQSAVGLLATGEVDELTWRTTWTWRPPQR
ncbi:N-acetylmuramoyl-L-alanine amidase [Bailinhaonella thermotolerans]|uniref:N-acetylmuramoyl-L-alanine amidase n=2 Tax=Bailinhaonella thermotolerans TaxID=1070861 RepID=A0A3A4A1I7_9ACTN|nr:N-acetylmuramoyl-L-alanine amidase [Bailinhaonella thermotolerans]